MPKVRTCIKAAPGRVELTNIDLPDPGPGDVLIRTTLSTICGSDLHIRDDIPEVPVGMPMGHEGVGVIEAVGEGVARFKRGDRVVSCCLQSCGTCEECVTLEPSVCSAFGAPLNLLFGCQGDAFLVRGADTTLVRIPTMSIRYSERSRSVVPIEGEHLHRSAATLVGLTCLTVRPWSSLSGSFSSILL
jgi:alcohol dehydrogenase